MKTSQKILLFCICSLLFIGCDRATKHLAKEHLKDQPGKSYLQGIVRLEYIENTGAMLSMGDNLPQPYNFILLSLLPLIALVAVAIYAIRKASELEAYRMFFLSLIVAGGIGNIIDRILYDRHVTDFMLLSYKGIHTGIFNVADVCVTAGAIGVIFFKPKKIDEMVGADN